MTPLVAKKVQMRFANLNEADNRWDDLLLRFARMVSDLVQVYLAAGLEEGEKTDVMHLLAMESEEIRPYYLTSPVVDSSKPYHVYWRSVRGPWIEIEPTEYERDDTTGTLYLYGNEAFSENIRGLKVQYTGGFKKVNAVVGWDYLEVPEPISTAAAIQAAYFLTLFQRNGFGIKTITTDDTKVVKDSYGDDSSYVLIDEVRRILHHYVRTEVLGSY